MGNRTRGTLALAALGFYAPMLLAGGRGRRQGPGIAELAHDGWDSLLEGWELVDHATRQVNAAFTQHSMAQLWEGPDTALRRGRGWSGQYNLALAQVLRRLGFQVEVVHASRVRGLGHNPWWQAGHTWLRVTHRGRTLDVCASRPTNRAGEVPFVPTSIVRPIRPWTIPVVSAAFSPVVAVQAWRGLLGTPTPRWMVRDFNDPL